MTRLLEKQHNQKVHIPDEEKQNSWTSLFFSLQHMEYMFFQEDVANVKRCKTSAILKLSQGKFNINNENP